jgi:hypothetical protein
MRPDDPIINRFNRFFLVLREYLLIDQIGANGWAVQLNPGQVPHSLDSVVKAHAPAPVTTTTPAPGYVKPLLSEVQFNILAGKSPFREEMKGENIFKKYLGPY